MQNIFNRIKFNVVLTSQNPVISSDGWDHFPWAVTVNGERFEYKTGTGLVDKFKHPKPPTVKDVMYALLLDADGADLSFEEWAENYGYNTDSRKAYAIYTVCTETAERLAKMFSAAELSEMRELLADY